MENDVQRILLTEEELAARVAQLGEELSRDYAGEVPVFVGVLKGVVVFFADLIRKVNTPCNIDFMWISSYAGTNSTGELIVKKDISSDIRGRHVVIVEDIFDTGTSLQFTYEHLLKKEPASLKVCTLLDKPERRKAGITLKPDYTGFVIPNEFVVGYGLDFNEKYRNLPFIGILKPEVYE